MNAVEKPKRVERGTRLEADQRRRLEHAWAFVDRVMAMTPEAFQGKAKRFPERAFNRWLRLVDRQLPAANMTLKHLQPPASSEAAAGPRGVQINIGHSPSGLGPNAEVIEGRRPPEHWRVGPPWRPAEEPRRAGDEPDPGWGGRR